MSADVHELVPLLRAYGRALASCLADKWGLGSSGLLNLFANLSSFDLQGDALEATAASSNLFVSPDRRPDRTPG